MSNILPIILSGGSGTRLWPLSRKFRPKQFVPMFDYETLFQATMRRLEDYDDIQSPIIVCNEAYRFMVAEQLRAMGQNCQAIILEPIGKNTAPAIALAALYAHSLGLGDTMLLILPADHVIADANAFHKAIEAATQYAQRERLVTFGIVPKHAEPGYGYIKYDGDHEVLRFVEKPDQATANLYMESGEYLWNSGMFIAQGSTFMSALSLYAPEVLNCCRQAMAKPAVDHDFIRINRAAFESCPAISFDYAVMEKATNTSVVVLDSDWSDVGAWSAVWGIKPQDKDGNALSGDVVCLDAKRNLVYSEQRLVTLLDVEDMLVIDTKDALLVARRDRAQHIKKLVDKLQTLGRQEVLHHREVYRPWGSYDSIDFGDRFQVKRIVVKPGARLSVQKHHHRAEHWVVVRGTAEVRCGDKVTLLTENQSTYIPLGEIHSLANPGIIPLEMIEVQSGSYLREDDVVRLDDIYGRGQEE